MIKYGITRIVLILPWFVIKIPNHKYSHYNFLQGCYNNWSERHYCKKFKKAKYDGNMYEYVAPSYYCSIFGLFQIQAKCKPKIEDLTFIEKEFFKSLCKKDNKKENFGYYNNKLVCLDYP